MQSFNGKSFEHYYLFVYDIMDKHHITSIVNCTNYIGRLFEQEDLDPSGVTWLLDGFPFFARVIPRPLLLLPL